MAYNLKFLRINPISNREAYIRHVVLSSRCYSQKLFHCDHIKNASRKATITVVINRFISELIKLWLSPFCTIFIRFVQRLSQVKLPCIACGRVWQEATCEQNPNPSFSRRYSGTGQHLSYSPMHRFSNANTVSRLCVTLLRKDCLLKCVLHCKLNFE